MTEGPHSSHGHKPKRQKEYRLILLNQLHVKTHSCQPWRALTIAVLLVTGVTPVISSTPNAVASSAIANKTVEPTSPLCIQRTTPPSIGLEVIGTKPLAERLVEVSFRSAAMNDDIVKANVLLPINYDSSGNTRYPVLYLFHGRSGTPMDWFKKGEVTATTAPVIIVMPEAGLVGWHSDWMGIERIGPDKGKTPPGWETFHLRELIPWVDATYPTQADRAGRSIAGLSAGGFGALIYAQRHPELFGLAGSLSGQIDLMAGYPLMPLLQAYGANLFKLTLPDPCLWGDPILDRVVWEDHNPMQLYKNLRGVNVFIAAGNGIPNKMPPDPITGIVEVVGEVIFRQMGHAFVKRLTSAAIPHRTFFTRGGHYWDLWPLQLEALLPYAVEVSNNPAPAPPNIAFSYRTAEPRFSAWGWDFQTHREVREFTYLDEVCSTGLLAAGSGQLGVTTPSLYQAKQPYLIAADGASPQRVVSNAAGKLAFTIDLGPANLIQQKLFDPQTEATFKKVRITITPAL